MNMNRSWKNGRMFRKRDLLRRSKTVSKDAVSSDPRPVALLADPYEIEVSLVVPIIEKLGFRVVQARDGEAALQAAIENRVSFVIASLDMPRLTGDQLCQKIRELGGPAVPFVLLSPPGTHPDKVAGFETFANDYAQRPLNLQDLEMRIH